VLEDAAVALLACAHLLFGLLDIVDVRVAAEPFDDPARLVAERHGQSPEPPVGPIVAAEAELGLKVSAPGHSSSPLREDALALGGMELPQPAVA
jgi:hypothetical protein